jgi:hypothetical protein
MHAVETTTNYFGGPAGGGGGAGGAAEGLANAADAVPLISSLRI